MQDLDYWRHWERNAPNGLVREALRCALAGDAQRISDLFALAEKGECHAFLDQIALMQGVDINTRVQTPAGMLIPHDMRSMTLMHVLALSLCSDDAQTCDVLDVSRFEQMFTPGRAVPRQAWRDSDGDLVRRAVALWRDNPPALTLLFQACARFISHPGFVQAFVDEGVDLGAIFEAPQIKPLVQSDRYARRGTTFTLMIESGNFKGAALLLSHLGTQTAFDLPRLLFKSITDGESTDLDDPARTAMLHFLNDAYPSVALKTATPGALASDFVDFLHQLSRFNTSSPPWYMYAVNLQEVLNYRLDATPNEQIITRMLSDKPCKGAPLAQMLSQPAKDGVRNKDCMVIEELLLSATRRHNTQILLASARWIGASDDSFKMVLINKMVGHSDSFSLNGFRDMMKVLPDLGIDLNTIFVRSKNGITMDGTILHALAASQNPQTCGALAIALEMGCDPTLRNGDSKMARAYVLEDSIKGPWLQVEQSFLARQAATHAIQEIADDMTQNATI